MEDIGIKQMTTLLLYLLTYKLEDHHADGTTY